MENFSFYMPTRLFFGAGSVKRLAKARLPQGTGLIITGGTSTTKLGYVAKVADTLAEAGHPTVVYNRVQPNPTIEGVRECAALCREQNIAFVVGLGGGSSIDTAKAVAIMATNDGDWWDYIHGGTGGGKSMPDCRLLPFRRPQARARRPTRSRLSPTARKRSAAAARSASRPFRSSIRIL